MRETGDKMLDSLIGADKDHHPHSTSTLKTETTNLYEALVIVHKSILRHIKEDENFTSWITMKMETVNSPETLIPLLESTPRHTTEDRRLQI
jgi:hypothetical protein